MAIDTDDYETTCRRTLQNIRRTSFLEIGPHCKIMILFLLEHAREYKSWSFHTDHEIFTTALGMRSRATHLLLCNHLASRGLINVKALCASIGTFTITLNHEAVNRLCESYTDCARVDRNVTVQNLLQQHSHQPILGLDDEAFSVLFAMLARIESDGESGVSSVSVRLLSMIAGISRQRVQKALQTLHVHDYINAPEVPGVPSDFNIDYPIATEVIMLACLQQTEADPELKMEQAPAN